MMKKGKKLVLLLLVALMLSGCSHAYQDGLEALKKQDYEQAAEQFEKAIDEKSDEADSYRGLGIASYETADYEKALQAFEQALEKGSDESASIYNLMGLCALNSDQAKQALTYFEKAQEEEDLNEDLAQEIAFNIIVANEKTGDYDTAKEKLASYLEQYPEDEKALKEAQFFQTQ